MSEDVEMTPITPEEGGAEPPKVASAVTTAVAPTVKLKPVIRKPMIRKPIIGGAKPVALKPATGTPPPPAAVPEAAAAAPAAEPPKPLPAVNSVTGPIPAQAILHKTGIIAEGILTPAQAQAAKTKTSRISLESAIGVAPTMKSSAPMKTIKLRRPTDIPPAPGSVKVAPTLNPAPTPAPTPAPATATAPASAPAPAASAPVDPEAKTVLTPGPATLPAGEPAKPLEKPSTVTQKKTLKLQRPGFKRPTVSGLRRPGETTAAPPTAVGENPPTGDVTELPTITDITDLKPLPPVDVASEDDSGKVAGTPAWLNVMTCLTGLAALIVLGFCTWTLFREAVGPAAGPNDLASFHSETDYRR